MDLLANYASSDEEEEESPQKQKLQSAHFKPSKNSTEILSRLPENDDEDDDLLSVDKNSSMFSLPPPKFSSSIIFSLPAPNASKADPFKLPVPLASSEPKLKRVVQFKPPTISSGVKDNTADEDDDDDEEEDEKERRKKVSESATQNLSVKSFLSSLPAPKSSGTLGALPLGSGTGRKSILEADVPASDSNGLSVGTEVGFNSNVGYYEGQSVSSSGAVDGGFQSESVDPVGVEGGYTQWATQGEDYSSYQGYTGYGNDYSHSNMVYASSYADYGQFEHNSVDGSNVSAQELPESAESALRVTGKRGRRNDAPQEIVEVKQDELMKNRPREDQARLTGIAFGPSYKAASTKGKPSKLHKRKHQISSLYFDMRQKEMELAERRARGMLTKAQTQGKYGW